MQQLKPAILTILPGLEIYLASFTASANVGRRGLVLNRSSEKGPATEARHCTIVDMFGGRLVANLT